jgi:two-component system, LytTR family, response regulator
MDLKEDVKTRKKIILRTSEKIYIVSADEIIRCEADRNYTSFFLTGERNILISKSIKYFASILSQGSFFRAHQAHLVNLDYVDYYIKGKGGFLIMRNNSIVPLSNRNKKSFFEMLNLHFERKLIK